MQKQYAAQAYTQQSIRMVSNKEYQIVREAYLKLSKKEYLSLTTALFLVNIVVLFMFKTRYVRVSKPSEGSGGDTKLYSGEVIVYLSQVTAAFL